MQVIDMQNTTYGDHIIQSSCVRFQHLDIMIV